MSKMNTKQVSVILLMLSYTKLQHLYKLGHGEQSIDLQLITAHRKGNMA